MLLQYAMFDKMRILYKPFLCKCCCCNSSKAILNCNNIWFICKTNLGK